MRPARTDGWGDLFTNRARIPDVTDQWALVRTHSRDMVGAWVRGRENSLGLEVRHPLPWRKLLSLKPVTRARPAERLLDGPYLRVSVSTSAADAVRALWRGPPAVMGVPDLPLVSRHFDTVATWDKDRVGCREHLAPLHAVLPADPATMRGVLACQREESRSRPGRGVHTRCAVRHGPKPRNEHLGGQRERPRDHRVCARTTAG